MAAHVSEDVPKTSVPVTAPTKAAATEKPATSVIRHVASPTSVPDPDHALDFRSLKLRHRQIRTLCTQKCSRRVESRREGME